MSNIITNISMLGIAASRPLYPIYLDLSRRSWMSNSERRMHRSSPVRAARRKLSSSFVCFAFPPWKLHDSWCASMSVATLLRRELPKSRRNEGRQPATRYEHIVRDGVTGNGTRRGGRGAGTGTTMHYLNFKSPSKRPLNSPVFHLISTCATKNAGILRAESSHVRPHVRGYMLNASAWLKKIYN